MTTLVGVIVLVTYPARLVVMFAWGAAQSAARIQWRWRDHEGRVHWRWFG